jgi:hypothetical protein
MLVFLVFLPFCEILPFVLGSTWDFLFAVGVVVNDGDGGAVPVHMNVIISHITQQSVLGEKNRSALARTALQTCCKRCTARFMCFQLQFIDHCSCIAT